MADYITTDAGHHNGEGCKCKPARRPRYNARVVAEALAAGHRYALGNGTTAYVIPTAYGYSLDYRQSVIPYGHPFYTVAEDGAVTINKIEIEG